MEKKYARLAALLAAAVLCGNGAPSMADELVGNGDNGWHIVINSDYKGDVYGNYDTINPTTGAVTGHVEMTGGRVNQIVYGGYSDLRAVTGSTVTITGGTVNDNICGGCSDKGAATGNTVKISGGIAGSKVCGGYSDKGAATGNTVTITGGGKVGGDVYGGQSWDGSGEVSGNTVTITGGIVGTEDSSSSVYGGFSNGSGEVSNNTVTITGSTVTRDVYGGFSNKGAATGNRVTINGGDVDGVVCGGLGLEGAATGNTVTITGGKVIGVVCGGLGLEGAATGNTVTITGGKVIGDVCGGLGDADVTGNTVELLGLADVSEASLYGRNDDASTGYDGNTLLINGWSGSTQSVKNFETIRFQGVTWVPQGTLLTTNGAAGELENTKIDAGHVVILGGRTPQVGEFMTFIKSEKADTGLSAEQAAGGFTQGVATVGELEMKLEGGTNNLVGEIKGVGINPQTDLIAENRAVAAAFVNQGADIAADSLRLLDDGYHYGTQTFGAVYGNRSQYDVASDIKINGWSEIAGFGNIHEVKDGRLAWGVFYENGTGNYRTWNTFNNEMFRGDGSLLYNGGGAAVRLTKDSGMYYEASLRAGTLSSSMTNAVKDGNGNSYGFDSDSTYWGAHIGAGKLIQRGSGQWDIYGKYFHTDIDGDSFEMGGDRFSFDSVTSDRLRLGARYTADTDKAWSLYCGAAYEYEFSGDSRMKAGQFEAPEQSLQGSTVFGEIGTVWGRKDSPWSMDVNLRGYAGEREGFSGMVQLAYAF